MQSRSFDFPGAHGQRLAGRLDLPSGPPHGFVLFAHCFTCTKTSLASVRIARALTERGLGVLRFDFTGLGESGGDFADATFSGDVKDIVAAGRYMAEQGFAPKLLVGHSLGGAAVLAAAADLPDIAAVAVVAAPFEATHVEGLFKDGLDAIREAGEAEVDLGGRAFTIRRSFIEDLRSQDQRARIASLGRPLLILHSPRDRIVGVENATAIFLAAHHPKSFVSLDDADHLLTRPADADYVAGVIAAWAARYLGVAADPAPETAAGEVVAEETGGGRFQIQVTAGSTRFYADEPVEVGGMGTGATPYQLLSAGLGACTAMTLRLYAEQKGWPLDRVRIVVAHSKSDDRTPPDLFTREITLEGDLDPAQHERLIEMAGRCPVHRTLENGSAIATVDADRMDGPPTEDSPAQHVLDMEAACASCP